MAENSLRNNAWRAEKANTEGERGGKRATSKLIEYPSSLQYADEHMEEIRESARNPFGGSIERPMFWMEADKPWQTLSTCIEIDSALRCASECSLFISARACLFCSSGDPASYVSHMPVHADGSCNGHQHYAALGRDAEAAAEVNLAPADRPADLYDRVRAR